MASTEWRKRNRERWLKWIKEYREKNAERLREAKREWAVSETGRACKRKYRETHRDQYRASSAKVEAKRRVRKEEDAAYYAQERGRRRVAYAKKRILSGKVYKPKFPMRIPDWATKGRRIVDVSSVWLIENQTIEQLACAREMQENCPSG